MQAPNSHDAHGEGLAEKRLFPWAAHYNTFDTSSATQRMRPANAARPLLPVLKALLVFMAIGATLLGLFGWPNTSSDDASASGHGHVRGHKHDNIGADIIQIKHLDPRHIPESYVPKGARGKRLVIVGDVHGCSDELTRLLEKVDFDKHYDHLILTGDMVDKGPDSHGVLRLAARLGASCVRGNHEDKLLKSHYHPLEYPPSQKIQTLRDRLSEKDFDYLLECPLILSLGDVPSLRTKQAVVVHAGLVPHVKLEDQPPWDVMHMRTMSKHLVPSEERDGGEPWWRVWHVEQKKLRKRERNTVIYGHDSRQGLVEMKYSVGLDTACSKGGKLTALVLGGGRHEHDIVSVKCADYS